MKKTYQIPEIEVTQMESEELLETSMTVSSEVVTTPLSRDDEMFFDED